jgi:hypothetical protein
MTKTYRLLKQHRVGSILHPPGSTVALSDRDADWLAAQGVIDRQVIVARSAPQVRPVRRGCAGCGW